MRDVGIEAGAGAETRRAAANPRVMGFDFGVKRIGVAAGNTRTGTSQGLRQLRAKDGAPDWAELGRLMEEWQPSTLLVGLPLHMNGGEGDTAARARTFGGRIRRRFGLEVVFVDERLTTADADALLAEATATGKSMQRKRDKHRDSLAAELIVRTYLEDNRCGRNE